MSDPVSWLVIEKGWDVVGSDGEKLGTVHEVVGDTGKDIFNGLAVSPGLLRSARYVPSESVGRITEGRVQLELDTQGFAGLEDHRNVPTSAKIRADTTDLRP